MYICVCMYVGMYVCMCIYICMYVCDRVCSLVFRLAATDGGTPPQPCHRYDGLDSISCLPASWRHFPARLQVSVILSVFRRRGA